MPSTDLASFGLRSATEKFAYRTPMKFGGRVVRDVTLVNVICEATNQSGECAAGVGSMTMGVAWAWPSRSLLAEQTLAIVVELAADFVRVVDAASNGTIDSLEPDYSRNVALRSALESTPYTGHPFRLCHHLMPVLGQVAEVIQRRHNLTESIPPLARLLAASPLQAALFDAHGKAAGISSFAMVGPEHLSGDLAEYLGEEFIGELLSQFVRPTPANSMPIYHLVGALDPLTVADVTTRLDDGLPESLDQWIVRDGLTHLKIKLDGADADWDLRRIVKVNQVANRAGLPEGQPWQFSLDFNERCENEEYLLRLLDDLEHASPEAIQRIAYIEQPTHRDLHLHPENTMHRVAARLPVVIDESLVSYESLLLARHQGYSGVAIKACKGHADALLMAAAAQHHAMFLCVQDLTCVGISFLHSAALTSHIPGATAIEGNGRQYCPAANAGWEQKFPGLFDVRGGRLPTALLNGPGLGY